MKLWKINVVYELVVRATDERDAVEEAMNTMNEIDTDPTTTMPVEVRRTSDLPSDWDGSCRPWGRRDPYDRTISQQLSVNAPSEDGKPSLQPDVGHGLEGQ